MRRSITCLFFLLTMLGFAKADTLIVSKLRVYGPHPIPYPYSTEERDFKGKKFDYEELIDKNKSILGVSAASNKYLFHGNKLIDTEISSSHALYALSFFIDTKRYQKVMLSVKKLKNYKLYVNERLNQGNNVTLEPGRTTFGIIGISSKEHADSIDISIISDSIGDLIINSTNPKTYDMKDMLEGDHYRDVSISPSGKYIITTIYNTNHEGKNVFSTNITDTKTNKVIIRFPNYVNLAWFKNRDVAYYTRSGNRGLELVTVDPLTNEENIIAQNIPSSNFTMSPNEKYLVYSLTTTVEKEKNGLKSLHSPDDRMPGWRNRNSLYKYDLLTGVTNRLTFGSTSVYLNDISADGSYMLLSLSSFETTRTPYSRTTLLRVNASTGSADTLIHDAEYIADARFSPDTKKLLVKASPGAFNRIGCELSSSLIPNAFDYRLYLYSIDSKEIVPLLMDFAPSVGSYQWNPNDGLIYFLATDGCDVKLYNLDPNSNSRFVYNLPVTYIQDVSISTTGKQTSAVFFGQTGERARDMYICTLSSNKKPNCRRIGSIDFDKLSNNLAIGTCHDWNFKSSRGDTIKGFYYLPPYFNKDEKYPLIVYYYGGCTPTAKVLEFQYPLQVFASLGYVVYVCEPSGAIGYGQEFASRHVNTWGIQSADDIIEGTKAFLLEHPYVDSKRIGCMGASYGGFMTQYLQTKTNIFAAAISHAGISNIASYWGGGYWGYTYGEVAQQGSFPWNNPELYVKQSPLFNAHKIETPLLLIHGTKDTNVPTNESQQMYTALKILGKRVNYIEVENQDHVIVDFHKREAWQKAIFAWFEYWLKDQPQWWNDTYGEKEDKF